MVRTFLRMRVREGCEQAFEGAWGKAAPAISRYPGNLSQTLMRDPGSPRTYAIMADWASPAHLDAFENSTLRQSLSAELSPLREEAHKSVFESQRHIIGAAQTTAAAKAVERTHTS